MWKNTDNGYKRSVYLTDIPYGAAQAAVTAEFAGATMGSEALPVTECLDRVTAEPVSQNYHRPITMQLQWTA